MNEDVKIDLECLLIDICSRCCESAIGKGVLLRNESTEALVDIGVKDPLLFQWQRLSLPAGCYWIPRKRFVFSRYLARGIAWFEGSLTVLPTPFDIMFLEFLELASSEIEISAWYRSISRNNATSTGHILDRQTKTSRRRIFTARPAKFSKRLLAGPMSRWAQRAFSMFGEI